MSCCSTPISTLESHYLPDFDLYIDPINQKENRAITKDEQKALIKRQNGQIDNAIQFLATHPTITPRITYIKKIENKFACSPPCDNSVVNLATYIASNPLTMAKDTFCCCIPEHPDYVAWTPIPLEAAKTLLVTQEQFNRNTCGLCCIAPSFIISVPFIVASDLVTKIAGIFSSLVLTTTAGTDTYVFSGDIGIVQTGSGRVNPQGGIRVGAIEIITKKYIKMAERIKSRWREAINRSKTNKITIIAQTCHKILNPLQWNFIREKLEEFGLAKSKVDEILDPLAKISLEIIHHSEGLGFEKHQSLIIEEIAQGTDVYASEKPRPVFGAKDD